MVIGEGRCVSHEPHETRVFLRGRPFVATSVSEAGPERQGAVMFANDSLHASGLPRAQTSIERRY